MQEVTMHTPRKLEDFLTQLRQTRDEMRLKLHLAGMEARTAWEKLEPAVDDLERRLQVAGERVGDELEAAFAKLDAAILGIRDQIDPPRPGPRP
jgi:hypothetical protein